MLSGDDIEQYLQEISAELAKNQEEGEIIICGGAVMTAYYGAREQTRDIDGLYVPKQLINQIARDMAINYDLESDWLNDGAKGFIDTERMKFETLFEYNGLVVKMPDAEAMLAMKLASARPGTQDEADAKFLMEYLGVRSIDQVFDILERNIHPSRLTPRVGYFAQNVFEEYKEEIDHYNSLDARLERMRERNKDGHRNNNEDKAERNTCQER